MSKWEPKHALLVRDRCQHLYESCYAFMAVINVAEKFHGEMAARGPLPDEMTRPVYRKRGDAHVYLLPHYLKQAFDSSQFVPQVQHAWLSMALIVAGDWLETYNYFNRAPQLEVIYHLRNAYAHENKFHFTKKCRQRLIDYPATTIGLGYDSLTQVEISAQLDGSSPSDLLAPGDVIDVLIIAVLYLTQLASGAPPLPYPRSTSAI